MKLYTDLEDMKEASGKLARVIEGLEAASVSIESVLHDMQVTWQGDAGQQYVFELRRKLESIKSSASTVKKLKQNTDERIERAQELDRICRQIIKTVSDAAVQKGNK